MSGKGFRVVVRGQFADLTDDQRASLAAEAHEHSFHSVAYTESGTFIYEPNLVSFNFRYEVRIADDDDANPPIDPALDPADVGLAKAQASLAEWGIGHKRLRATATDMAQTWSA